MILLYLYDLCLFFNLGEGNGGEKFIVKKFVFEEEVINVFVVIFVGFFGGNFFFRFV